MEQASSIEERLQKMSKTELEGNVEHWREVVSNGSLRIARKLDEERDGQHDEGFDLTLAVKHLEGDAQYFLALKKALASKV